MKGGENFMDEDSKRSQWRIMMGLEEEYKPARIIPADILKRAKTKGKQQ
jgi:hypothetical protein